MSISFVGSADLGNNSGGSLNLTTAYTVGSGSNRILFVGICGDQAQDDITSVTYNGTSMTLLAKVIPGGTGRIGYLYYLANPSSGSHNVSIDTTNVHYILAGAADYDGASQTGIPDNSGTNSNDGTTGEIDTSLTPVASGSWIIYFATGFDSVNPMASANGSTTRRSFEGAFGTWALADTNGPASGATTMGLKYPGAGLVDMGAVIASFAPVAATGGLFGRPTLDGLSIAGPKQFARIE